MATAEVPRPFQYMASVLICLRRCTANVLTVPCAQRIAAYIPIVFRADGTYDVLNVAIVEIKFAQPKLLRIWIR